MTATTALTAQNMLGVRRIHHVPPGFVREQINACAEDIDIDVVKTERTLTSVETIEVVADSLRRHAIIKAVVDLVMVAASSAQPLPEDATHTLCSKLVPEAFILTPNISEANLLSQEAGYDRIEVNNLDGLRKTGRALRQLGPDHVLLKGGHSPLTRGYKVAKSKAESEIVVNLLFSKDGEDIIELP